MTITLCRYIRFTAENSRRARRDHHLNALAVRGDRLVGGRAIICTIRRYLNNRIVDLIKQRTDLGWIIRILIRGKGRGREVDYRPP
jgi:hypothetical protein